MAKKAGIVFLNDKIEEQVKAELRLAEVKGLINGKSSTKSRFSRDMY